MHRAIKGVAVLSLVVSESPKSPNSSFVEAFCFFLVFFFLVSHRKLSVSPSAYWCLLRLLRVG